MVLGHEAAGKIVELGDGVKKLKVGEHVVFAFLPSFEEPNVSMALFR